MKTFLEVENKMGTTIQTSMPNSQIRTPLPITNPNVHRSNNVDRRKTVMPKRKFWPVTAANPPIPQAPLKPNYEIPPAAVRADTPWPGAGEMLGNLFKERNWPLLEGYLAVKNKKSDIDIPSPKEKQKAEKPVISDGPKKDKCGWGPDCPFCKVQEKKEENPQNRPLSD